MPSLNAVEIDNILNAVSEEAVKSIVRSLPERTTVLLSVLCNQTGSYRVVTVGDKFAAIGMAQRAVQNLNQDLDKAEVSAFHLTGTPAVIGISIDEGNACC